MGERSRNWRNESQENWGRERRADGGKKRSGRVGGTGGMKSGLRMTRDMFNGNEKNVVEV